MNALFNAPLRAAIFDLDGTLVDSEPIYAENDVIFLEKYGIALESLAEGGFAGLGTMSFLALVAERFPDSPLAALPLAERARLKDEAYLKFSEGKLKPFPAVVALAREFARRGLRVAVASGSSPHIIERELEAIGLALGSGPIELAVSASQVARGKPEPDVFLEAARRLGVAPEACLAIEDSRFGVVAAARAGMRCLALPAPGAKPHPDFARAALSSPGGAAGLELGATLRELEKLGLPVA